MSSESITSTDWEALSPLGSIVVFCLEKDKIDNKKDWRILRKFLLAVNRYIKRLKHGDSISKILNHLEELDLIYQYNKNLNLTGRDRVLCDNIYTDEDLKIEYYALAYACNKFYQGKEYKESFKIHRYLNEMTKKPKV